MRKWIAVLMVILLCMSSVTALAEETEPIAEPVSEATATPAAEESTPAPDPMAGSEPTQQPDPEPTPTPEATAEPTATPALAPESSATPTAEPTATPTVEPSAEPTVTPTATPEASPTAEPTDAPEQTPEFYSDRRVTMGADLTDAQRAAVYADFGIEMGSVKELTVTNAEERVYLEGIVSERRIGSVALSCIYITTLPQGEGLTIELHNINYCTEDMYKNALTTAGITDAYVVVSAPFPVSGTGALTGAYKAYEDITGTSLNELAKLVGAEELVLTGELSEYIGSEEASEIIRELKGILDQTQSMSDDQVKSEIRTIADAYKVSLTDGQVDQILSLCRKLEGLDEAQLQSKLTGFAKTAEKAGKVGETVTKVYENVTAFFDTVGQFFKNLFKGNWRVSVPK